MAVNSECIPTDLGDVLTRGEIAAYIRRLARNLALRGECEKEDAEQTLIMQLLENLDRYDPAQGTLATFAKTVLKRKASNMRRAASAEKRNRRVQRSLSEIIEESEGSSDLASVIGERELEARTGNCSLSTLAAVDLADEVENLLAPLTPEERAFCEELKYYSVSEIARLRGEPRSTVALQLQSLQCLLDQKTIFAKSERNVCDFFRKP